MFEQEIEMEKKESSIVPLLLIVTLIVGVVGVALYFVAESRKVLTTAEAAPVIVASLESQGPPTVRFETGNLSAGADDPRDPQYRLLEKAGYLKIGKQVKGKTPVSLTSEGEAFLAEVAGVKKSRNKEGYDKYVVPLAERKLVELGKIAMVTPSRATVEYTWKWVPNKAGDLFDAAGDAVKAFNGWDRANLIEKHGANFYHEGPTKVVVALTKADKGWKIATE